MDYEKDTTIDESALDVEWLRQAELTRKYAKYLKEIRKKVRRLQERKKTIRSELILKVNNDSQTLIGKNKPNAADIEAFYRTQKEYKEAVEELIEEEEELKYVEDAFSEIAWTRKKALENLVILHGQQYFAGPKVPRDLSKEWEQKQKQKQVDSGIAKSMKRRNKNEKN